MSDIRMAGPKGPIALFLDDVVVLRKPHPCGGDTWRIVRLGADIGLRCVTCSRRVLVARSAVVGLRLLSLDERVRQAANGLGVAVEPA